MRLYIGAAVKVVQRSDITRPGSIFWYCGNLDCHNNKEYRGQSRFCEFCGKALTQKKTEIPSIYNLETFFGEDSGRALVWKPTQWTMVFVSNLHFSHYGKIFGHVPAEIPSLELDAKQAMAMCMSFHEQDVRELRADIRVATVEIVFVCVDLTSLTSG